MSVPAREADAIVVGMGWTGGILAAELTKAGLDVVGLERGPALDRAAGAFADIQDELGGRRKRFTQEMSQESWTLRHSHREAAFPFRNAGAFTPGVGVGGSSLLYGSHAWRLAPHDFVARSATIEHYGEAALPDGSALADWGITYDDLEPYYDAFERMAGIGGVAGNLQGAPQPGGNPFEGPRSSEYPVPPPKEVAAGTAFADAARGLGYHPFPIPGGTLSQPYTNPDGIERPACTYCGFCNGIPCEIGAKADASVTVIPVALRTGRLDLRPGAYVFEILHDGRRAVGVRYHDEDGTVREQRAAMVILTAYALSNVRLLLLSGMGAPYDPATGTGVVGRNASYNWVLGASGLFADRTFSSYAVSGATGSCIAEFNADNFDHMDAGFVGGGLMWSGMPTRGPLSNLVVPPGTPRWGAAWKQALHDWYDHAATVVAHGEVLPYRDHHVDLDPTYNDAYGHPLLRITFDWRENERRMYRFFHERVLEIVRAMEPDHVVPGTAELPAHFDTVRYQNTHNTGGAIMGPDPGTSVVNPWLQMWDFENVWVVGGSAFPQSAGAGPTGTICALAYRAADGIVGRYLAKPGPLA